MRRPPRVTTSRRAGFTLVEVLVVILIIAILAALLVPAIAAAVAAANNARVSAEEQNLQTALAEFKNKYGEYPPSRIILYHYLKGATAPYTTGTTAVPGTGNPDLNIGDLNQRTVTAMRKYFPRAGIYFPTSGVTATASPWPNPKGGTYTILEGHECLVFFLGGMPQSVQTSGGGGWGMTGFSRDPVNPFTPSGVGSTSRTVPMFEFAPQRLVDLDGDGFPSYIDPLSASQVGPLQRPYAYFSAYGNNGYDPNDDNSAAAEQDDAGNAIIRSFFVNFNLQGGSRVTASPPPNPYTIGDANPVTTANPTPKSTIWANAQTFQLISAGRDGLWGLGGPYDANSTAERLPIYTSTNDSQSFQMIRTHERDNITNFAGGKLD